MIVALGQINPTIGDCSGNIELAVDAIRRAEQAGADLVVLPELTTLGYPPRDLLLRDDVIDDNLEALRRIAASCASVAAVVGHVVRNPGPGQPLQNAASLCLDGQIHSTHIKSLLPNYDVFDERRYFNAADSAKACTMNIASGGVARLGITICEDLWNDAQFIDRLHYNHDPIRELASQGIDLLINVSASPFWVGKQADRRAIFSQQIVELRVPLVYVNQVGGNDDLIFDGGSMAFNARGELIGQARAFEEDFVVVNMDQCTASCPVTYPADLDSLIEALVLGTRDYARKCGFKEVVLGLSGGIDSSVTAAIAAQALGEAAVHGIALPSRHSSTHSLEDAETLAERLGIDYRVIPIEPMHAASDATLASQFKDQRPDTTEENLQARIRGQILMALSNKFGWLPLATGNKSELAVGYCTLYGDMCGGLAVLSDVPKTTVYEIARRLNEQHAIPIIPGRVLTKPPSAELKPDQTDQDSLPPYDQLDAILARYVELQESSRQIVAAGFDARIVDDVLRRVDRNEYKRRQAPPGLKVTARAFGAGWRMPIAARIQSLTCEKTD